VELFGSRCVGFCSSQAAAPSLTALRSVRLAESFFVGSGSVAALASVPTLTTVDLSHCYDLDGLVLGRLAALPCLEALVLRGCVGMRGLRPADWSRSSRLRYIDASFCGALTDDCAAALATCPALTTLQLDNCMSLTVDGIAAALTAPRLRRLSLSDCDCVAVSDALRVDRLSGSAITDLDLAGCETLSRSAVAALANCTALRRLDLRRCLKVRRGCASRPPAPPRVAYD
jgi:F-box/leucine-rich repeat protein 14